MSRSEFRYNKRRKHYAYLFRDYKSKVFNILISSKPIMIEKKNKRANRITINVPLYHHPSKSKSGDYFVIPIIFRDSINSFDTNIYKKWVWDINDKRKIKRIKRKSRLRHHLR